MAKGVRIGYWACRSKKARKRNRYSHSAVFKENTSTGACDCTGKAHAGTFFTQVKQLKVHVINNSSDLAEPAAAYENEG
ncbi:hypothetical protein D3C74_494090 [compost metagenome]